MAIIIPKQDELIRVNEGDNGGQNPKRPSNNQPLYNEPIARRNQVA